MDIITVTNTKDIPTMYGENYVMVDICEEFTLQDHVDELIAAGKKIGNIYLLKGTEKLTGSFIMPGQNFYYIEVKQA